jgi:ABC-type sugar transport system ATPase subunit
MIVCENISWSAGSFSLSNLNLSVPARAYAVLMGKSGCGKTSLLEMLCGLRHPDSGRILLDGAEASSLPPGMRRIGYVPQDSALFPTYTVRENIAFAPRVQGCAASETRTRVDTLAEQLGITHLLDRLPAQLSGGERQRTALGRALAAKPRILLLDEPLSALDEDLRAELCALLQAVHRQYELTTLHVTHSRREAQELADLRLSLDSRGVQEHPDAQASP